jgi:hypothetical protein
MVSGVPVTLLYNAPAPAFGAAYVTYKQGSAPPGLTTYTTTFPAAVGATGSLSAMCDDSCTVSVNGTVLGTIATFNTIKSFALPALLANNTLSVAVTNLVGNTGVAFSGTITAPTQVKPPVSTVTTWVTDGPVTITYDSATNKFTISGVALTVTKQ